MSETSGSRPADPSPDGQQPQQTPEQAYDVPVAAQQYGQPPASGYQPPAAGGQSAPVQGPGPQQYGQPEHGQASYAQEGFPAFSAGGVGHDSTTPGQWQQPVYGQQPHAQHPYPGAQPYAGQPAQSPVADSDQRLWATLTHLSTVVLGFVGPVVAWAVLKDRAQFLRDSTTEALNFSITFSGALVVSSVLAGVSLGVLGFLPLVVWVVGVVFCVLAAIATNKGEVYRYPVSWRLVK